MPTAFHHIDPSVLFAAVAYDLESFRELSLIFLRIAPPMLEKLQHAMHSRDCAAAMRESHALKSTAALVGATALTRLAAHVETIAFAGSSDLLPAEMQSIANEFVQVMAEVRNSIDSYSGANSASAAGD